LCLAKRKRDSAKPEIKGIRPILKQLRNFGRIPLFLVASGYRTPKKIEVREKSKK
jgi:hypothetical protein